MAEWISVKDRLPEAGSRVLVFDETSEEFDLWSLEPRESEWCPIGWYDSAGWFRRGDEITHWMPLPEPPKEDAV